MTNEVQLYGGPWDGSRVWARSARDIMLSTENGRFAGYMRATNHRTEYVSTETSRAAAQLAIDQKRGNVSPSPEH